MSIQTLYTGPELAATYPVGTTQQLLQTIALVDRLVQDGVLSDYDLRQILPTIGTALDAHLEPAAVASATYTGTAAATSRSYFAIPIYPLPTGSAANPRSIFINQLPIRPGGGRSKSVKFVSENDMQTGFIGGSAAVAPSAVVVANTALELDQTNFVTIVAPPASASVIPGVTFDIFGRFSSTQNGVTTTTTYLVKKSAVASSTVIDSNQAFQPYTLPAHTQYAVDTTVTPAIPLQGPRSILQSN